MAKVKRRSKLWSQIRPIRKTSRTVRQGLAAKGIKAPAVRSPGEQLFAEGWRQFGSSLFGDQPAREHHFYRTRDWRFDFAWPECLVAVEIEGATFANGRHTRGAGFRDDCIKYNAAAAGGWLVFRFTTDMLEKDLQACVEQVRAQVLKFE